MGNHNLRRLLSKKDAFDLLDLMDAAGTCSGHAEFVSILNNFGRLFGAEASYVLVAGLNREGKMDSIQTVDAGFPKGWLDYYISEGYYRTDPVVREHYKNFGVQHWESTYEKDSPPRDLRLHLLRHGLKKGYSCGARRGNTGSMFSFAGDSLEKHPRTEAILQWITPLLHETVTSVLRTKALLSDCALTKREREILQCIKEGRTDASAAVYLNISEHTVKFHVKNILYKLNATSRYHAVAIAFQRNFI